jgi:Ni,Fe-hydrogenase III component G
MKMNDIEKAIEVLKEQYITVSKCLFAEEATERNNAISLAISALEKQLNGVWIPVSEKLPKENEEVLITLIHGKVTWAYLHQREWYNMFSTYPIERVIAWMPLPEPFKEDVE